MLSRARNVATRARRVAYRRVVADRQLARLVRSTRAECWCGGGLLPFPWNASYGTCERCGTYVNRRPIVGEQLARLYELDLYWHVKQRADGMPPIEERRAVDDGDGRVQRWLELVEEHTPCPGVAVEVGCSHGLMLERLASRGWTCVGVEVDPVLAAQTSVVTGIDVRAGVFPGPDLPACNLFLAFDVLEHSADPLAFMVEARRLLRTGGIAIVQTPIDRYSGDPPFARPLN